MKRYCKVFILIYYTHIHVHLLKEPNCPPQISIKLLGPDNPQLIVPTAGKPVLLNNQFNKLLKNALYNIVLP